MGVRFIPSSDLLNNCGNEGRGKMKKKILWIGTGGTIASMQESDGLSPSMRTEDLLTFVPDLQSRYEIVCSEVCRIDSTNMTPAEWIRIAETIQAQYDAFDGFVITHGTDTLAYTASALSYMIQDSPKPIVLTGAQKPAGFGSSDTFLNLTDSFTYASSEQACGVRIVFNGIVIEGTRARKTRTRSYHAFSSVNYPVVARIQDQNVLTYIEKKSGMSPRFYTVLDPRVVLIKLTPGQDASLLNFALEHNDGVIIESFGLGGLPGDPAKGFYRVIEDAINRGKVIVLTTQVPNEGSSIGTYRVGYHYKNDLNILEAYDMTSESATCKLMWILGQTREPEQVREMFLKKVANDILRCQAPLQNY